MFFYFSLPGCSGECIDYLIHLEGRCSSLGHSEEGRGKVRALGAPSHPSPAATRNRVTLEHPGRGSSEAPSRPREAGDMQGLGLGSQVKSQLCLHQWREPGNCPHLLGEVWYEVTNGTYAVGCHSSGTIYVFIQLIFISPACSRQYHHSYFTDEETEVLSGSWAQKGDVNTSPSDDDELSEFARPQCWPVPDMWWVHSGSELLLVHIILSRLTVCLHFQVTRIQAPQCSFSTIHSSQDIEATWMSIKRRMDKEDVVYIQWNITQPLKRMK